MTDIAIRPAYSDAVDYGYRVEDGAFELASQLNTRSIFDAVQLPGVEIPATALNTTGDASDLYDSGVEWLEQNGYLENNDLVVIGHGQADEGFGESQRATVNGKQAKGGICYADGLISPRLVEIFTIHEFGHIPFGAGHDHGAVKTNSYGLVTEVTPMAAGYTIDSSGLCDTQDCGGGWPFTCGGDTPPSDFCDKGVPEYENETANGFETCPIHTTTLSECTMEKINDGSYNSPR